MAPAKDAESWTVEPNEKAVELYLDALPLPTRLLATTLDRLVREELPDVKAGIKWGVPFYFLSGPVCYVSGAKAHVTFGLAKGHHVDDASGLLTGTGKSPIRKAIFKVNAPVPDATVRAWLQAALRADATWRRAP